MQINRIVQSPLNKKTQKGQNNINFKGCISEGAVKISHLPEIQNISNKYLDNIFDVLSKKLSKNDAPNIISEGSGIFNKIPISEKFFDALKYPLCGLPFDILNSISNKFNLENFKKWKPLQNYNEKNQTKAYERAMRGLLQNGDNFIEKSQNQDEVVKEFYKLFDDNFSKSKAKYNTPHERTVVRLVTGLTAASMLGNDFYNKSIMNGKSDTEANEELKGKRKQEMVATVEEAISQYFMLSAFSDFTNNSKWGAPVLNTALGIFFHITSRFTTGRSLTRIKPRKEIAYEVPSINEFRENASGGNEPKLSKRGLKDAKRDNKKHLLSFKNIGLACLASIGIGFLGKGIKSAKVFTSLQNIVLNSKFAKVIQDFTVGKLEVDKGEFLSFVSLLESCEKSGMQEFYYGKNQDILGALEDETTDKIFLGEYEKMSKVPIIGWEFSRKELLQIPLAIPKLAVELFSYPYKAAHKILEGFGVVKKVEKPKLRNDYNILHTYLDYKEQLEKAKPKTDEDWLKFRDFYKQRIDDNIVSALNNETKSKVDNAAIGKTTQLLGTFGSLYFAMTDDYNRTIKQTNDPEKAGKDARLRGVNKMVRISTQSVCMGINQLFKIPYARSIVGAGLISIVCTIMTDTISRFLSGMPSRRMNKEELEQYNQHKKQGALRFYYDILDRLTD